MNTEPILPRAGEVWRHYKGGQYQIICVAIREESKLPVVVYRPVAAMTADLASCEIWVRDLWQWQEMVKTSTGFVKRYQREGPEPNEQQSDPEE